jgi:glycosyltransferase involved in cell wall biosynthesis
MTRHSRLIRIFTPSVADEANTNAQNLTVKEVVARLDPELFHVTMISSRNPDPRIAQRKNTTLLPYYEHGNTLHLLLRVIAARPDIYFFPRYGPLDRAFLRARKYVSRNTALITYVVMMMNEETSDGAVGRLIREADRVYANSTFVAGTVYAKFGLRPDPVYDGADHRFFFPPSAEKHTPVRTVVLYAGSFQARKRVEVVVQQAARRPDAEFRLAGRGVTEPACRSLAKQLSCTNVVFLGHLTPAQLGEQMREADVFLFPSMLEGHPQVLIQAIACGLPSVVMSVYRPDAIVHGETGFLADDDQELADNLDILLDRAELRQRMSAAAVLHAQRFDWDRIAQEWAEVFQEVVRQNAHGRPATGN